MGWNKLRRVVTGLTVTGAMVGACLVPAAASASVPASCPPGGHYINPPNGVGAVVFRPGIGGILTAEPCVNGYSVPSVLWSNFTPITGGFITSEQLGKDTFWDPTRYGGSTTIWANVLYTSTTSADFLGLGGTYVHQEELYFRIWITPRGQVYTYAGP